MRKITFLLIMSLVVLSCKNESKKDTKKEIIREDVKENFPVELGEVYKKHGGINTWRKAQILSFNKGEEVHTVDLHSRKTVVNSPKYSLGFDGKKVWLDEEEKGTYKGNPNFYYNLYFYFYAMPFVLADDGISYDKVDDLVFEGNNYSGYKISYASDKGTSPDDNYFIYYNPKTFQMEWLAYTVTFKSKEPSDNLRWIKYHDWENVNGLILPKSITWYNKDDNGLPSTPRGKALEFTLPLISQGKLADSFFEKPKK